jgi:hypothetical protein
MLKLSDSMSVCAEYLKIYPLPPNFRDAVNQNTSNFPFGALAWHCIIFSSSKSCWKYAYLLDLSGRDTQCPLVVTCI